MLKCKIHSASTTANNTWWYRWDAAWTRRADRGYDLLLSLYDIGSNGLVAPTLVKSWTRTNFRAFDKSYLFVRNVSVTGYASGIEADNVAGVPANVSEYCSGPIANFNSATPPKSMNLPIAEAELIPWESNLANWASTGDSIGSDAQKLQDALDSGKPAIMVKSLMNISGGSF